MTPQLFIDCSSTRACDFNSGIQRVVRSLCRASCEAPSDHLQAIPSYGCDGSLYRADSLWPQPQTTTLEDRIVGGPVGRTYRQIAQSIIQTTNSRRLERWFLPPTGHSGAFKLPRKLLRSIQKRINKRRSLPTAPPLACRAGDVLLMADASWMIPNWECVANAQAAGAFVGTLVYDLIPITHPQFFPTELVACFRDWFARATATSDFFLCISECVAQQVRDELHRLGMSRPEALEFCRSFPLGADLRNSSEGQLVSSQIQNAFLDNRSQNPYLMVGTIEPRKNHEFVLDSFEHLWQNGAEDKLCIVGRVGWNCDELVSRIRSHPRYGESLMLFHDASDADIDHAYQNAKSVIMASHTEGFGLPIVEALQFGQRVLASDTAIHREVGCGRIEYFSIERGSPDLADLLATEGPLQADADADRLRWRPLQWAESYTSIVEHVLEIRQSLANSARVDSVAA